MKKIRIWLIRLLCGEKIPIQPSAAIWELIDEENQKLKLDVITLKHGERLLNG